jgi:hypothetical protein
LLGGKYYFINEDYKIVLKFSKGHYNKKLRGLIEIYPELKLCNVYSFSLPAGYTCAMARDCKSRFDPKINKIIDDNDIKFRCYAVSLESVYNAYREMAWHNYNTLRRYKGVESIYKIITDSIPMHAKIIRIHVGGDFYSEAYFGAWLQIAIDRPDMILYGYTKRGDFLIKYAEFIPNNFRFTYSIGGLLDNQALAHGLKCAKVIYREDDNKDNLPIMIDESSCLLGESSFCILVHGTQPAGMLNKIRLSDHRKDT